MQEAVAAARSEERLIARAEIETADMDEYHRVANQLVDRVSWAQQALAEDFESLGGQVERCLEALAERIVRQQAKAEKRQGKIIIKVIYIYI